MISLPRRAARRSAVAPTIRPIIPILVLSMCATAPAVSADSGESARSRVRALELLRLGRPREAAAVLESTLEKDPAAIDLLELLGKARQMSGDDEAAIEIWERALRAFPERRSARLWLGQLLEMRGSLAEARRHFEVIVAAESTSPADVARAARLGLVRSLLAERRHAEARTALAPLLGTDADPDASILELRALREAGDLDEAVAAARRLLEALPDGAPRLAALLRDRAAAAIRAGSAAAAVADLQEAVALHALPELRRDLALALRAAGDVERAAAMLEALVAEHGATPALAAPLAEMLIERGQPQEALALASAVRDRDPNASVPPAIRIRALAALEREQEALAELPSVARAHALDPAGTRAILDALESLDRFPEAMEAWIAAIPEMPAEARPLVARACIRAAFRCRKAGDPNRARRLCAAALALAPGDIDAHRELGWAELESDDPEGALRAWQPVLVAGGGGGGDDLLVGVPRALRALGRIDEAIDHVRASLERDPENRDVRHLHWSLLADAKREDELLAAIDPDELSTVNDRDAAVAAALLRQRLEHERFRDALERWLAAAPDAPGLRRLRERVLLAEARIAVGASDLERAKSLYRDVLEIEPRSLSALRGLARVARDAGDPGGAIRALREADRIEPENAAGKAALAGALRRQERVVEARQVIDAASPTVRIHPDVQLEEARIECAERRFVDAAARASRLAETTADRRVAGEAWLLAADAFVEAGMLDRAREALERRARMDDAPSAGLLGRLLRTAIATGDGGRGVAFLEAMADRSPPSSEALAVLASHFVSTGDLDRAYAFARRRVAALPDDGASQDLLGEIALGRGDPAAAREAFLSARALDDADHRAISGLARAEEALGRSAAALATLQSALDRSPRLRDARLARARVLETIGDHDGALRELAAAAEVFPDALDVPFLRARALSAARRADAAIEELEAIARRAAGGALAVLRMGPVSAYHEADALPAHLFRDQLRALRAAGYESVGLDEVEVWLSGRGELPRRAVLLTFDEPRPGLLTVVTPILDELGFIAVSFIPTALVGPERGFYASWADLERLAASESWQFGARGHRASRPAVVDEGGDEGPFLASRLWLADEGRTETADEMSRRIAADHRECIETLRRRLGILRATAYAVSPDDLGQRRITNEPFAYDINTRLFRETFPLVFCDSRSAHNLRKRRLPVLDRLAVPADWDGKTLVAALRRTAPAARARLEIARIRADAGDLSEALREIDRAAAIGADERDVRSARAHILLWQGDRVRSAAEFRRLREIDPSDPRALEALEDLERLERPAAAVRLDVWWDRDERSVFRQVVRGEHSPLPWLRIHGEVGHATYRESGSIEIEALTAVGGVVAHLAGPTEVEAAGGGSWFHEAPDAPGYSAAVRYRGIDAVVLEASAAGGPVETPRAVRDGIRQDIQSAAVFLRASPADRVSLSYRHAIYSDENRRDTVRWEYGRRLLEEPELRVGYTGVFDDTHGDPDEYYSPQDLHVHRAFARVAISPWTPLELAARAGVGYGWEDERGRVVGEAAAEVRWTITDALDLSAGVSHFRNPRYWAGAGWLSLGLRF